MANRCGQGLRVLLVGFVLFFATSTVLTAQDEGKGDSSSASRSEHQKVVEQWTAQYDRIADQLHVSCPGLEHETAMVRQTILSLDNQQFAGRHGRVYLWTRDGLPVVLSVIMSFQDPENTELRTVVYELNSLTSERVVAKRNEKPIWDCVDGAIEWKSGLIDLPVSPTRAGRLTQMRNIARMFEAGTERNLFRLMPQPIYRYPETVAQGLDGAIFNFAVGSDPGIYLLIEARKDGWHVGTARSNVHDIEVRKDSKVIWRFEGDSSQSIFQRGPFYQKYTAEKRKANDPTEIVFSAYERVP